jgi:hypothetical protein
MQVDAFGLIRRGGGLGLRVGSAQTSVNEIQGEKLGLL